MQRRGGQGGRGGQGARRHQTAVSTGRCIAALLIAYLLISCGQPPREYGVVLWGGSRFSLEPGTLVAVEEMVEATDKLRIEPVERTGLQSGTGAQGQPEPTREAVPETLTVRPGYIKEFPTLKEARRFRDRFEPYADTFATARVRAVRIREEPAEDSPDVYRLRREERVKVVRRAGERTTIGSNTGHWYEVLTSSGYRGYAFGPLLRFPLDSVPVSAPRRSGGETPSVERFLSATWRPAYMREMIRSERVDLRRFDPHIGLFPEPEEGRIVLNTGKSRVVFEPLESEPRGGGVYSFADGELRVRFADRDEIVVRYEQRGNAVRERYVRLGVDMEKVIERERERRALLYRELVRHGTVYESEHYGEIRFLEDRTLAWSDRGRLPARVVPADAEGRAHVRFNVFLGEKLKDEFDGSLTLLFDVGPRNHEIALLYRLLPDGLQFTHVPVKIVRDDVIQRVPGSPLIMYFRARSPSSESTR